MIFLGAHIAVLAKPGVDSASTKRGLLMLDNVRLGGDGHG